MSVEFIFKVDGKLVPINRFCLPAMSLSSARSQMKRCEFCLSINKQIFEELLKTEYQQLVNDLKDDDEQVGSAEDELGFAGYPDLHYVINNNELVFSAVYYLFDDLIGKFSNAENNIVYWHDELTYCESQEENLLIYGICYSKV